MIKEDYVSLETAKILKEKGFREITNCYYNAQYNAIRTVSDTFMMDWNDEKHMRSITMPGSIAIPTVQMVLKWFMEEHNIFVAFSVGYTNGNKLVYYWIPCVLRKGHIEYPTMEEVGADSYEEAYTAAIDYCLKHLIK